MPNNSELFAQRLGTQSPVNSNVTNAPPVWEVIVKYHGSLSAVQRELGVFIEILNENYAIFTLSELQLDFLYSFPEIEYIELPKYLTLNLNVNRSHACITAVHSKSVYGLLGEGVIVAVLDSGIDYTHPDFTDQDGGSRILYIWDQTRIGSPPAGFNYGSEYTKTQIDAALAAADPYSVIPPIDIVGHGTAVTGIAAGNGRASNGANAGVAPNASIIAVKIGSYTTTEGPYAKTTELMRAVKYVVNKATALNMPLSINISYGTSNGAHDGNSLFEEYLDEMSSRWKTVITVASGNEGISGHHFEGKFNTPDTIAVDFVTGPTLENLYLSIWKNFVDTFELELITPTGITTGKLSYNNSLIRSYYEGVIIYGYFNQPTHYNADQEIFYQFHRVNGFIPEGLWSLRIICHSLVDGRFNIWLPTLEEVSATTRFATPSLNTTLTLPSTARSVVSAGGYDSALTSYASFSGRGFTRLDVYTKPDIVAPSVNILSTRIGGGYDLFSGTSMSAPFVAGAAAIMMEWGIVQNNDPFLYGQRVKAFLRKGASRVRGRSYPNNIWGYGTLCLKNTMDYLVAYVKGAER